MNFETENIEFKSVVTDEIYKEIIAFANTEGGIVYVGIDNEGNVIGLNNVDEEYTRITNGIRDAIMPDVTMFVRFTVQDNKVVRITVSEGSNKPYYLKSKGLKPSGVYVRQGTSSAQASYEQIRQMIKESDGDSFENMRSLDQDLSFNYANKFFNRYGLEFSEEKYLSLGMLQKSNKIYTNLALLISDQCQHSLKIAVFGDDDNTIFKDAKEFSGSIFEQLDEGFKYLTLCNKTKFIFKGLERVELRDYPEEAIREALLNAVIHRDYGFSGSIIVNVNESEMEFISLGGLLPGLSPEDIKAGISQPRNKNLAEIFHRLRLIESYGTGIRKIYRQYRDCNFKPRIEVTSNTFKMILPNMNAESSSEDNNLINTRNSIEQIDIIQGYIEEHGRINEEKVQELLNIKKTRAYIILKQMQTMGLIESIGRGKNKVYVLTHME